MDNQKIQEVTAHIQSQLTQAPEIGMILGSGLGVLAEEIDVSLTLPYDQIPYFPTSTVSGHAGQLIIGTLRGKNVIAMQGRFHFYEGYTMEQVTFPVRVMAALGIQTLIVTNAAGGINENFEPGDLMIMTDHINQMGTNPLIGPNDDSLGVRFPDMSECYDRNLIEYTKQVAKQFDIHVQTGVYVANTGPMYETPAEVKMLRILGADAVGMSTVPEVIVARHANIKVLGISCISNMAAGILATPLSHDEVIETTNKVRSKFINLLTNTIKNLPSEW